MFSTKGSLCICSHTSNISKNEKEFTCIWCGFTAEEVLAAQKQAGKKLKAPWWAINLYEIAQCVGD
jgi:hypothetical protein